MEHVGQGQAARPRSAGASGPGPGRAPKGLSGQRLGPYSTRSIWGGTQGQYCLQIVCFPGQLWPRGRGGKSKAWAPANLVQIPPHPLLTMCLNVTPLCSASPAQGLETRGFWGAKGPFHGPGASEHQASPGCSPSLPRGVDREAADQEVKEGAHSGLVLVFMRGNITLHQNQLVLFDSDTWVTVVPLLRAGSQPPR